MSIQGRWIKITLCAVIALFWLTSCETDPSRPRADATPTAEPSTPPPEAPTVSPTATATGTPLPEPPTPTGPSSTPLPTATSPPPVAEPFYEDRAGPTTLLASYYNAINRREYTRAWDYWETPPNPSYEDFVAGFAETAAVQLAVRPPTWFEGAAGSMYARVPALVDTTHRDGSQRIFVGCFVARRPNVGGPGVEQVWTLFDATLDPALGDSTDALLLTQACQATPETSYDDPTGAVRLLASYYNALNLGEYARAWDYWETPPNPTFEDFVAGFSDTESMTLVVRPPMRFEGAAGSTYVDIPALVSATHTDSSRHHFAGCFVARKPNVGGPGVEQVWALFDVTLDPTPGNTTDVTVLDGACDTR